jgi:ribose transport system substrate-binding protein
MARQIHLARTLAAFACAITLFTAGASWAQTKGPRGETATPSSALTLTDEEVEKVKAGKHTAALVWHMSQTFTSAVTNGATDEFKRLGIEIVATTDAGFDAAKQQSDVETALVREPDIILTLPIDVVSAAEAFRPAVERGTKLVILSNPPDGYVANREYVTVVTDDIYEMGKQTADALAKR